MTTVLLIRHGLTEVTGSLLIGRLPESWCEPISCASDATSAVVAKMTANSVMNAVA